MRLRASNDPAIERKLDDIVGLYLDPPKNAIVLSIDEKSQFKPWNAHGRSFRYARGFPSGRHTTTPATESPICIRRST